MVPETKANAEAAVGTLIRVTQSLIGVQGSCSLGTSTEHTFTDGAYSLYIIV